MYLYEKYRPHTFEQVQGQSKAVAKIKHILMAGWGGRAWWISGASGTGKTTLGRIIASQGADDFFVQEYDSADSITVGELDDIERTMHLMAWGRGGRVWIINEAHGLRRQVIRRLLGLLEHIPQHCVFIFTTTKEGEEGLFEDQIDASPLLSRCTCISLTNQGLAKTFANHCRRIAEKENLNGRPVDQYIRLAQSTHNNCRAMLMAIESGEML